MTTKKQKHYCIEVEDKWCKKCGICIEFCAKEVFCSGKLNRPVVSKPEACIGCRLCELRCPEFAVTITEKDSKG